MKKNIITTIIVAAFIAIASVIAVSAQSQSRLSVNVPFDFYIKGQKMAAGKYTVESITPRSNAGVLAIRSATSDASAIISLQREADTKIYGDASLLFTRYGNTYYLARVDNPNERFAAHAVQSTEEKRLAKMTAADKSMVAVKVSR